MSSYGYDDDEPRRYRNVQTRPRGPDEPDYVREETYIERGKGPGPSRSELVYRGREDSIEDIPRDFPPPGGRQRDYQRSSYKSERDFDRRSKSARGYSDDNYSDDERYTQYSRTTRKSRRGRDYDSDYSDSPPRSARSGKSERRKSGFEEMLGSLGLGGIAGALAGKKKRDGSNDRSVRSGRSRSRAGSRSSRRRLSSDERSHSLDSKRNREKKWAQAAQAALLAGAVEAFRSRKEPGPWNGQKGKRVATAALASGGIDGLLDRNPNEKTKRHLAEAVLGGLAANRLANGPRSRSRGRDRSLDRSISPDGAPRSRSRSIMDRFRGRSQSRPRSEYGGDRPRGGGGSGMVAPLAAGGALAVAGKAVYDRVRSRSRKRRSQSRASSADSYVPSRNRRRGKRRSPRSDTRNQGGNDRSRDLGSRDINGDNNNAQGNGDRGNGALVGAAAAGGGAAALAKSGEGGEKHGEEEDSSSTTDMENKRKHMKGKELLTAGLATIATIHAAHGVYSSMAAHEKRHRLVAEGEMTPQEARKKQTKAWVQDAAAVGIAALGIKGAFSEWKEMNEHRYISPSRYV